MCSLEKYLEGVDLVARACVLTGAELYLMLSWLKQISWQYLIHGRCCFPCLLMLAMMLEFHFLLDLANAQMDGIV